MCEKLLQKQADEEGDILIWKVAAYILKEQTRTAKKTSYSSLGLGQRGKNS
jgi:hypothetical protein